MSSFKPKNKTQITSLIKVGVPILTLILGSFFYYQYSKKASTLSPPQSITQSVSAPSLNNSQQTSNESIHKKVVIPNQPGNVKELLTILATKAGLQVDWKLKGYYNLSAQEISQFNNPIGLIVTPLTDMMTLHNKELKVQWVLGNPGEPFPYPLNVMTLACGKTLMFFELEDPNQLQTLLNRADFKHCSTPDSMLGSSFIGPEINQYDFSQPPPFLKPYDTNTVQPQATEANKINEAKIDPKFSNQNQVTPQFNWANPTGNGTIEFVPPTLVNEPVYSSSTPATGASVEAK